MIFGNNIISCYYDLLKKNTSGEGFNKKLILSMFFRSFFENKFDDDVTFCNMSIS